MADEQLIKPRELPPALEVYANDAIMTDDGVTVARATPSQIVNAGAPVATEAEALAGVDNTKRMTPLRVKQILDSDVIPAVQRAQAWAESPTPPDPAQPASKSSKTWADESAESARIADEAKETVLAGGLRERVYVLTLPAGNSVISTDRLGQDVVAFSGAVTVFAGTPSIVLTPDVDFTVNGAGHIVLTDPVLVDTYFYISTRERVAGFSAAQEVLDGFQSTVNGYLEQAEEIVRTSPQSWADFQTNTFLDLEDGSIRSFNSVPFERRRGVNLPGLASGSGWQPIGDAYPEHYGANPNWTWNGTGPFNDCGPALNAALVNHGLVRLRDRGYFTTVGIQNQNRLILGTTSQEWPNRSSWIVGGASVGMYTPLVSMARSAQIENVGLRYASGVITGGESEGQRRLLGSPVSGASWQRGGYAKGVVLDFCGTAIGNINSTASEGSVPSKTDLFSVQFDAIEIRRFSHAAIDFYGAGTGNFWGSTYIGWTRTYDPDYIIRIRSQNGESFTQLNVEHTYVKKSAIYMEDVRGFSASNLHIEGVVLSEDGSAFIDISSSQVIVDQLSVIHTGITGSDCSLIVLGDGDSYSIQGVLNPNYQRTPSASLLVGDMQLRGLANPNGSAHPDYPTDKVGINTASGFKFIKRKDGFPRGWSVHLGSYTYTSYRPYNDIDTAIMARALQRPLCDSDAIFLTDNTIFGRNVVPNPNFLSEDGYSPITVSTNSNTVFADNWEATSNTGGSPLVLSWFNDPDPLSDAQRYLNVQSAVGGLWQQIRTEIRPAQRFAGAEGYLKFSARNNLGLTECFTSLTVELVNAGGTPSDTLSATIAGFPNNRVSIGNEWTDIILPVNLPEYVGPVVWGSDPIMRLVMRFNNGTSAREVDLDIKNVRLIV